MQKRDEVQAAARRWKGTPVLHQHAIQGFGVDCWKLIEATGTETGVLTMDAELWAPFASYGRQPSPRLVMGCAEAFLRPTTEPLPADIALIAWREGLPMHFALLAEFRGRQTLIHALGGSWETSRVLATGEMADKVVEHGFTAEWPSLVHSWWRYPGLT